MTLRTPADPDNRHSQDVMRSQAKHRERFNAYQREYWARPENQAKLRLKRQRDDAWRKARLRDGRLNRQERAAREKVRSAHRVKAWREAHPERWAALRRRAAARRYARRLGAAGSATVDQIEQRWAYYGNQCWMCGAPATQTDHVIPLNLGGTDWPANQRPACARCNRAKSDKPLSEVLALAS